VSETQKQDC